MKIKAIFMDMDGTVLTSEHKVSDKLKNKLNELEEKGFLSQQEEAILRLSVI